MFFPFFPKNFATFVSLPTLLPLSLYKKILSQFPFPRNAVARFVQNALSQVFFAVLRSTRNKPVIWKIKANFGTKVATAYV